MPVTPFHVGPGSLVKAVLREKFSLTIFGFAQIVIDLQPLIAMLGADIELHGFTHTYLGATLVALVVCVTGKPLCEYGLRIWNKKMSFSNASLWHFSEKISWSVVISSAFLGTYSHVLLDSIMHAEIQPFYPLAIRNQLFGLVEMGELHKLCAYAGLLGFIGYFSVGYFLIRKAKTQKS
jgi:hypothetical protein